MVVNKKNKCAENIKFISYDGEYPSLCHGVLVLEIDGKIEKFGHHYTNLHWSEDKQDWIFSDEDAENPNHPQFWTSGGEVRHNGNYGDWNIITKEWVIDVNELPEEFWNIADELDEIINENIPYGCCGGCI